MSTDQDTDRQSSQREEWEAASQYTTHSPHRREEYRNGSGYMNQYANQPPPPRERRQPPPHERRQPQDQYAYQPPSEGVERESLLSRVKRQTAFWTIASVGGLVIFVLIGMIYAAAGEMGLVNTDFWMANFGMVCGMFASWWLYGQVLKKKFGYPSIFA